MGLALLGVICLSHPLNVVELCVEGLSMEFSILVESNHSSENFIFGTILHLGL